MKKLHRRFNAALSATLLTLAGSLAFAASPAQAYGSEINPLYATVDTGDCVVTTGTLYFSNEGAYCLGIDTIDNTYFYKDSGGVGAKFLLRDTTNGGYVGKVEFHPSDEKLWVYDTRNDGDTIYARVCTLSGSQCWGPYAATGTDAVVDKRVIDLDIAEGTLLTVNVCDDANCQDIIKTRGATA